MEDDQVDHFQCRTGDSDTNFHPVPSNGPNYRSSHIAPVNAKKIKTVYKQLKVVKLKIF